MLFFVSVFTAQASVDTVPAEGPFKKVGLFSKSRTAKSFKKKSPKTKYYKIAAKKQRKAKWHRRSLLRNNSK
ncbi:hypothetical protein D1627_04255 [Pontibacter oryzae]|uniref:Uncharacterized protein n=1 Tax=Pontibacter oryzae TaxID=2304593 RepID=A0A399SJ85_9BACT|nr:hypothetical protein D1627_04255 [Pontibacter oryzae]